MMSVQLEGKDRWASEPVCPTLSSSANTEFWWIIVECYPGKRAGEVVEGRPELFLQGTCQFLVDPVW